MRTLRLNAIAALMAATLAACGGGGGGEPGAGAPSPSPAPAPVPAPPPASAPVNTLSSSSAEVPASGALTFSIDNGNLISVDDPDGGPLTTVLSVSAGFISVTLGGAATVDGHGTPRVTIRGTITDINAALNGMTFTAPDQEGTVALEVSTRDETTPTPLSDTDQFTIDVTAAVPPQAGSAPVNTLAADEAGTYPSQTVTFNAAAGNLISVSDSDSPLLTTVLTVRSGISGAGTLTMASGSQAAITGNGSSTVTVAGSAAEINTALNGMVYTAPSIQRLVTFQIATSDQTAPAPLTDTDQLTIVVRSQPAEPPPAPPAFSDFQPANRVLGQHSMGAASTGPADGITLSFPTGSVAVGRHSHIFVPDTGHHRVLVLPPDAGAGSTGVTVIGQGTFLQGNRALGRGKHPDVSDVSFWNSFDGGADDRVPLVVTSPGNHSSALYDYGFVSFPERTNPTWGVGQVEWSDVSPGCHERAFNGPRRTMVVHTTVVQPARYVIVTADTENNRVTIMDANWPEGFPDFGPPLNTVLGQANAVSCAANRGGLVNRGSMSRPQGLWTNGVRLAVADTDNHRVLLWSGFPRGAAPGDLAGPQPDLVLGQNVFTSSAANRGGTPSLATLNRPTSVASDGTRLAIADSGNNRVLIWLTWPTSQGQPADVVLGQPDGSSVVANASAFGTPGTPNSRGLKNPSGLHFHEGKLYVTDRDNHRILIFNSNGS